VKAGRHLPHVAVQSRSVMYQDHAFAVMMLYTDAVYVHSTQKSPVLIRHTWLPLARQHAVWHVLAPPCSLSFEGFCQSAPHELLACSVCSSVFHLAVLPFLPALYAYHVNFPQSSGSEVGNEAVLHCTDKVAWPGPSDSRKFTTVKSWWTCMQASPLCYIHQASTQATQLSHNNSQGNRWQKWTKFQRGPRQAMDCCALCLSPWQCR
jgi:hypothetical protein